MMNLTIDRQNSKSTLKKPHSYNTNFVRGTPSGRKKFKLEVCGINDA